MACMRASLASHTLYHCEKEGLVTLRITTCVQRQKSGATNHLRDFEMCGVTSSNATCNEALGIVIRATITSRVSNGANALIDLQVPKMSTGLITEDQQNRVAKAFI